MTAHSLRLPRELRDQIITLVIKDRHEPPKDNHHRGVPHAEIRNRDYQSWLGLRCINFEVVERKPAAAGLPHDHQLMKRPSRSLTLVPGLWTSSSMTALGIW